MNMNDYNTVPSLRWRYALFTGTSLFLVFTSMALAAEVGEGADGDQEMMWDL